MDPTFVHGVDDVFGIGVDGDVTGLIKRLDACECGEDFHAVICGLRKAAAEFFPLTLENK